MVGIEPNNVSWLLNKHFVSRIQIQHMARKSFEIIHQLTTQHPLGSNNFQPSLSLARNVSQFQDINKPHHSKWRPSSALPAELLPSTSPSCCASIKHSHNALLMATLIPFFHQTWSWFPAVTPNSQVPVKRNCHLNPNTCRAPFKMALNVCSLCRVSSTLILSAEMIPKSTMLSQNCPGIALHHLGE